MIAGAVITSPTRRASTALPSLGDAVEQVAFGEDPGDAAVLEHRHAPIRCSANSRAASSTVAPASQLTMPLILPSMIRPIVMGSLPFIRSCWSPVLPPIGV